VSSNWPDGWITALLKDAGLPVTDFNKRVLLAWNATTPTLPYTNNPLGMPAVKGQTSELMRTGYAMFSSMPLFRQSFTLFLASSSGREVRESLSLSESYPQAYRAAHSLAWPANKTETNWPSGILDLTSESYLRSVMGDASSADRKTSGEVGAQPITGNITGASGRNAAQVANAIQQAGNAFRRNIGR
jgi:hypothetical protein